MSVTAIQEPVRVTRVAATLLPIMGVVLVAFLVIGLALPVLPLHVHHGLGLSTFVRGDHQSITSTAIYTALAPNRFKEFWRD